MKKRPFQLYLPRTAAALTFCLAWLVTPAIHGGAPNTPSPPAAVLDRHYLYEIVRHLYRWHLDERDLETVPESSRFLFQIRRLMPTLDPGDASEFAEISMPLLRMKVVVKRSDYIIEETGDQVRSEGYRIIRVEKTEPSVTAVPDAVQVVTDVADLREYLFRTRAQVEFPDERLSERLRLAVRRELGVAPDAPLKKHHTAYLAPLSPVANEWWVFWETGKRLIQFSSDTDLTNPEVWDHEQLQVRVYDVYNQVVVTMDEIPGSNEFRTRDQIGRALYNCIVLGKRLDTPPASQ